MVFTLLCSASKKQSSSSKECRLLSCICTAVSSFSLFVLITIVLSTTSSIFNFPKKVSIKGETHWIDPLDDFLFNILNCFKVTEAFGLGCIPLQWVCHYAMSFSQIHLEIG